MPSNLEIATIVLLLANLGVAIYLATKISSDHYTQGPMETKKAVSTCVGRSCR